MKYVSRIVVCAGICVGAAFPASAQSVLYCEFPEASFGGSGLPDSVTTELVIEDALEIRDCAVRTVISHTFTGDVGLTITSPDGTAVTLHEAVTSLETGTDINVDWCDHGRAYSAPFDGYESIQPAGPGTMEDFASAQAGGTWVLDCVDIYPIADSGILHTFCLFVFNFRQPKVEVCSEPALEFGTGAGTTTVTDGVLVTTDVFVNDVEVTTEISHTWISDIYMTVTTPMETTVVLHEYAGGDANDLDVTWSVLGLANGSPYDCDCIMKPPDALGLLVREPGLGAWALTCTDEVSGDVGTLDRWCVRLFGEAPVYAKDYSYPFADFGLGSTNPATVTDVLELAADRIPEDLVVQPFIDHANVGHVELSLTSPSGTTVVLHDNGAEEATGLYVIYDDDGAPNGPPYWCYCRVQPAGPGSMSDFARESEMGDWTMTCTDAVAGTDGSFIYWRFERARFAEVQECSSPSLEFGGPSLPASVSDRITILDDRIVEDIDVYTELSHSWLPEVTLTVTAPSGDSVTLFDLQGTGPGGIDMYWSDYGAANGTLDWICGPECLEQPVDPATLGSLAGSTAAGDWGLEASDSFSGDDSGTLERWCVKLYLAGSNRFKRGDVDGSGTVSGLLDGLYLLSYGYTGGPAPPCLDAADVDGNNSVFALVDALYLLQYAFIGTSAPPAPGPSSCGEDPEGDDEDGIDCAEPGDGCG